MPYESAAKLADTAAFKARELAQFTEDDNTAQLAGVLDLIGQALADLAYTMQAERQHPES